MMTSIIVVVLHQGAARFIWSLGKSSTKPRPIAQQPDFLTLNPASGEALGFSHAVLIHEVFEEPDGQS
jgi:hypothetical protein